MINVTAYLVELNEARSKFRWDIVMVGTVYSDHTRRRYKLEARVTGGANASLPVMIRHTYDMFRVDTIIRCGITPRLPIGRVIVFDEHGALMKQLTREQIALIL